MIVFGSAASIAATVKSFPSGPFNPFIADCFDLSISVSPNDVNTLKEAINFEDLMILRIPTADFIPATMLGDLMTLSSACARTNPNLIIVLQTPRL
jgi:hypothetical protein